MPRGPRLDAPDTLHHVRVRGIEGRAIFRDAPDREDFLRRLGEVAGATDLARYAWALLPNHLHRLVRTGATPVPRAMRSLLTGDAGACNRRHRRRGHRFQNRDTSIVVEAEPDLLELVRYIHLNPLRALDRYPYTGHAVLLGRRQCPGQDTGSVVGRFAPRSSRARGAYRAFVGAGIPQGRRPAFQGGGLVRSLGGWAALHALRRGREHYAADARVLGSPAVVAALRRDPPRAGPRSRWRRLSPAGVRPGTSPRRSCRRGVGAPWPVGHGRGSRLSRWRCSATRRRGWCRCWGSGHPPSRRPPSGGGRTARDGIVS
jgi:putative transposase